MKILVKYSTLKKIMLFIILLGMMGAGLFALYKLAESDKQKEKEDVQIVKDIINNSPFEKEGKRYTYSSDPVAEATYQAENDAMVLEGIKQAEKEWADKHPDSPEYTIQQCAEKIMARRHILHQIYKAQYIVKNVEDVKQLRAQIMNEIVAWHQIRDNTSDAILGANMKSFEYYTDKISATANRQRLLEGRYGLDYDADTKEYKTFVMSE